MTDTLAALLIPQAYQDADGLITESVTIPATTPYTFQLGSKLNPPYPSGVPLIPAGAAPLSPAPAPTAGAGLTTGSLANNGVYKWALSLVTKYGETVPSNLLTISGIGSGNTGQTLNLPAGTTGTGTNPVLSRRLWRTKAAGSQLYLVAGFDDANVSVYVDEVSDTELVTMAPSSDTSGLEGAVSITGTNGGGTTTWTEMPEGTTPSAYGQFTVSYDVSNSGGIITFYSGDAGKAVSVQYSAATFMGSAYSNLFKTALQTIHDRMNAGGVRQSILYDMDHDAPGDITVSAAFQYGNTGVFGNYGNPAQWDITTTGGDIEVTLQGWPWNFYSGGGNWIRMAVSLDAGPAYPLSAADTVHASSAYDDAAGPTISIPDPQGGTVTSATAGSALGGFMSTFGGTKVFRGVAAGAHTVYLLLQAGGPGGVNPASGFKKGSNTSWFSATIKEIG